MDKTNYILMVFEGEKTEKAIFDNLKKYYLNEQPNTIVYGFHCGEIYRLYHELQNDDDLEIFVLLKDNLQHKNLKLQTMTRDQVAEIYLFFDYDGHATQADDRKLQSLLKFFDNETEQGKLFISYPMVEAIRHLKNGIDFKNTVEASTPHYKAIASSNCDNDYKDFRKFTTTTWHYLIDQHCKKANFIVHDSFEFPTQSIGQLQLLAKQKEKYINRYQKVAVLSAFPLFIVDYYGVTRFG